jgi:hypothetical protein
LLPPPISIIALKEQQLTPTSVPTVPVSPLLQPPAAAAAAKASAAAASAAVGAAAQQLPMLFLGDWKL